MCVLNSYDEQQLLGLIIVNSVPVYRLGVKFFLPGCISVHLRETLKALLLVNTEKCILL